MSTSQAMLESPVGTGAVADRAVLKRVIRQFVISAIAFVLTAAVWEFVVGRLHARPLVPEPFKTKIDLCLSKPGVDTVFIGSSRFFHGIDPAMFDAEAVRAGAATHSYNLGFDALDFPELRFVLEQVLDDPRSKGLRYVLVEPSLRVRLAPGLEHSQRALTLHDAKGSQEIAELILMGNHDWKRKLFWLYEQGSVSAMRLTNVGALTNRYVHPQEPDPDAAALAGPMGDGYSGLTPHVMLGPVTTAADISKMVADQKSEEKAGTARSLNTFEIAQLGDLQILAARHGVKLILLAPPTAAADIYAEFSAVSRGSTGVVPMLSFADPITYFDLYDPDGFVDPDHIDKMVAEKWSAKAADAFAKLMKLQTPVSEVPRRAGSAGRQVYALPFSTIWKSSNLSPLQKDFLPQRRRDAEKKDKKEGKISAALAPDFVLCMTTLQFLFFPAGFSISHAVLFLQTSRIRQGAKARRNTRSHFSSSRFPSRFRAFAYSFVLIATEPRRVFLLCVFASLRFKLFRMRRFGGQH